MQRPLRLNVPVLGLLFFGVLAGGTFAAQAAMDFPWVRAEWVFAASAFDADGNLEGGLLLRMAPGWHGYGPEPGEVGVAPILNFSGLEGVRVGDPRFPVAQAFEEPAGVAYGYDDAVFIRFVFSQEPGATFDLDAPFAFEAEFLFCRDICVPYTLELTLHWPRPFPGKDRELQDRWQRRLALGGWGVTEQHKPTLTKGDHHDPEAHHP